LRQWLFLLLIRDFIHYNKPQSKRYTGIEIFMNEKTYNVGQEVLAACQLLDVDPCVLLKPLAMPDKICDQSGLHLTAAQIAKLFAILVTEYGKDDFHIKLADGFAKASFGHAFLALQCSENLHKGIYRVARFKELIEPVRWRITESDMTLNIQLQSLSSDFQLFGVGQIMSFLWLVKSMRNVSAKTIHPISVCVTDPFPYQDEIKNELGCKIDIGEQACIVFRLDDLAHPILSVNRYVTSGLEAGAAKVRLHSRNNDNGAIFSNAVYKIILELLPSGVVTSERTAMRLALSKRTFERRLSEHGVTFSELLSGCRQDMVRHYLLDTRLPINEISLLLGYREVNSFYRAFKEWFDCSPLDFRNHSGINNINSEAP
jgi:AraC-like DNA-binding protein